MLVWVTLVAFFRKKLTPNKIININEKNGVKNGMVTWKKADFQNAIAWLPKSICADFWRK